jgi:uroporphyrinogen-III synthase
MTVLVTRGWPGAERTASALRSVGIDPIISPVLDINFRAKIDVNLDGVQALAFSSANGVRAWGPRRDERDYPVFAVASTTAESARDIGFRRVHSADGNVESLVRLVKRKLKPEKGALLHVRGIHIAGDMSGELKAAGFTVRETIGYGAVAVDMLGEEAIAAIVSGAPVSVLIHSARGAKTFLELLGKFGLTRWLDSVTAYGMSENALKPLHGAGFAALRAASSPDEKSLLALLTDTAPLAPTGNAF